MPSYQTPTPSRSYADLLPYQRQAIDALYGQDQLILQAHMGAGKHVIAHTAVQELIQDHVLTRVLVVTTPRIRDKVWAREPALWDFLEPVQTPEAAADRHAAHHSEAPIVVISFDALMNDARKYDLAALYDGLLIDELTKGKAPTGARSKAMVKQLPRFKWRAGLTGTFGADGKPEELFGQVRWISGELGRTVTAFRQNYLRKDEYTHTWGWAPGGRERALDDIRGLVYQVSPDEYEAGLPDVVHTEVVVELPADAAALLAQVATNGVAEWEGHELIAETAAIRSQKAHQIADGFFYDDEGHAHRVHDTKLDALGDLLDMIDSPVIVAYQYVAELDALRARYPAPCMGTGESADDEAWNRGEIPLMYLHPQSAAHGLNLQYGGHTIIFYSQTWSRDNHDQLIARLRRRGQPSSIIGAFHLLATGDARILDAVKDKREAERALLRDLH